MHGGYSTPRLSRRRRCRPIHATCSKCVVLIGEPQQLASWTNRSARLYGDDFRFLGSIGDDHVPRTPGWDRIVIETLSDMGTGLCYGDDLLQGSTLPTACFMTSDIVRALGYMCPPVLIHMYVDNFWMELGKALDRIRYLPEVVIDHMHMHTGKASRDSVYSNGESLVEPDRIRFTKYVEEQLDEDVARVRALFAPNGPHPTGTADLEQMAIERAARQAAEAELTALLRTRVFRWSAPLRRLRTWDIRFGVSRRVLSRHDALVSPHRVNFDRRRHSST